MKSVDEVLASSQKAFHELFWDKNSATLKNVESTSEELLAVMENLGFYNLADRKALIELVAVHPNYFPELKTKAIDQLHSQWWGDDPIECRLGWEALEQFLP